MELFIHISKSAAILALFYIVYAVVLRRDTFFTANRHYLLSGIIAAIVVPYIEFTKIVLVELPASSSLVLEERAPLTQFITQDDGFMINWWQVAVIVYGIGALIMMLRFLKQLKSLIGLLKKYPSEKKGGYTYITVPNNSAPFSFFKYIIYNPSMHSREELAMILKHEEIHGSQWHSIDIIVTNMMLVFQWINPLAWLYKKRIEENLEFLADSATAQHVQSIKQYQLALVKASSTIPIPALTNNFYQSFIKKRIVMLNKSTSKKINVWKLSIILPLLAVFLWSFNVKEVVEYTEVENNSVSNPVASLTTSEENSVTDEASTEEATIDLTHSKVSAGNIEPIVNRKDPVVQSAFNSEEKSTHLLTVQGIQDILLKITKDTTKEELDAMKAKLEKEGFTFDYSNLDYNAKNEIIGISFKYKSTDGKSGNYSVYSDSPINTIIITSEGKNISVGSSGHANYVYSFDHDEERYEEMRERHEKMKERAEERHEEMKERKEEMKARQKEMKIKRLEMREDMKEQRKEMHEAMREKRKEMKEHNNVLILEGNGKTVHRLHDGDDGDSLIEIYDIDEHDNNLLFVDEMEDHTIVYHDINNNSLFRTKLKRITKTTTKNDLERLKNEFKAEGITFSYSSVKRNSAGEITRIKLKLKDNNGSVSSSNFDGEGKPINTIKLGIEKGTTIMYSKRYKH